MTLIELKIEISTEKRFLSFSKDKNCHFQCRIDLKELGEELHSSFLHPSKHYYLNGQGKRKQATE